MKLDIVKQIELFKEFVEENYIKELHKVVQEGKSSLLLDFQELARFDIDLSELLLENTEDIIKSAELSIEQFEFAKDKKIRIRFRNLPPSQEVQIRNLRSIHLNKFLSTVGIVRQASDVRPQVTSARFECPSCGNIISILQLEQAFKEPSRCSCGRKGRFRLIGKDLVDAQRLVIEETSEVLTGGEQPKRISVFLKGDLVEPKMERKTTPGSKIKVYGIVKEIPISLKVGTQSTRYDLTVDANYVESMEERFDDILISEEDERKIKELSLDPRVFEKMVKTIAPSIYGHEDVKTALLLQLLGGVKKFRSDGTKTRGDMHVLLVGDPGCGKSQMLKFISNVAIRGRYVSGKGATSAGLTATVVKDEFLKGWALEAGALVLCSGGTACLDELDKMTNEDSSAMHEALEQQCMLPDFKLMLSNGSSIKIGNLVDNLIEKNKEKIIEGKDCQILPVKGIKLLSTDFNSQFISKVDRISRHKSTDYFMEIELTNGRIITVTPEHPCWVVKNGKIITRPAEKLNENMFFPIPSKIKIKEIPYKKQNDILCKILGYHLSDGCYELNRGKKNGIQFWNNDILLINDYKSAIKKYFKINPGITKRKHQFAVRVISKEVVNYFNKLDVSLLEKGDIKKIPESIMSFPEDNIKYLLRALFDGDGSVIFQKRGGCRVTLTSQNRELIEQVSDLLLRFDIQSSIFKDKSGHVWVLDTTGQENLSKFLQNISFLSKKKRERLKKYCKANKTYRTIKDVVPECTDNIYNIFKKLKISAKKEIGHQIDRGVQKHRLFLQKLVLIAEKELLKKDLSINENKIIKEDLENIKKLAFGYARWMKIKKVTKVKNKGIKWVYDVTIEPHHTFISNGMILHNTITIAKANIQASLKAETAVLAAANPKLGRFDPYMLIGAQISMPLTLINRFDLIFPIKDMPSKEKDEKIASHILEFQNREDDSPLNVVELDLFKKYIAYARQKIKPILTRPALEEIKNFYVNLRNQETKGEEMVKSVPITARQLEALVRLAEASAKVRLSNQVEREDSQKAINILKHCLMGVGYDYETNTFDIDRISTGITSSQRNKIIVIRGIIDELTNKGIKSIAINDIISESSKHGISESQVEDTLNQLRKEGFVYESRRGYVNRI